MPKPRKPPARRTRNVPPSRSSPALDRLPSRDLVERVATILDQARNNVVRAVNSNMVLAYWLIGREIVQAIQGGRGRADYGQQVLAHLAEQILKRYGPGFSVTNLRSFRKFFQIYPHRLPRIQHPVGAESALTEGVAPIPHPAGAESEVPKVHRPVSVGSLTGFSPQLSWSHYRALMRVENPAAREFYEREAIAGTWDKRTLERQIQSGYHQRLLKSQQPEKLLENGRALVIQPEPAIETLKAPYVLEFLGLPEVAALQETDLETAILSRLQAFLLELGNGFALVARQKRLRFGDDDRYVDLVFYHCRLKFYLLIDLKIGELTHGDVGQIDGYVRMFDDLEAAEGDNPTIGLILCAEKNEAVARYSVLKDRKQIFASKYMLYLPTEAELIREIQRERRLVEDSRDIGEL